MSVPLREPVLNSLEHAGGVAASRLVYGVVGQRLQDGVRVSHHDSAKAMLEHRQVIAGVAGYDYSGRFNFRPLGKPAYGRAFVHARRQKVEIAARALGYIGGEHIHGRHRLMVSIFA